MWTEAVAARCKSWRLFNRRRRPQQFEWNVGSWKPVVKSEIRMWDFVVTERHCKAMEPAVPLLRNGTARQWNQPLHDASRYLLGTSDADQKRTDSKTRSASTRTAPTAHSVTCHAAPHAVQTLVSFSVKPRSIPDPSIWDMWCWKWRWVTHLAAVKINPATLHARPLLPTLYNLTNEQRR